MKLKKKIIILLIMTLNILCYSQFAGGTGTIEDPYQIATAEQLNNIRYNLTSSFIQTADIDLGVAPWSVGEGWDPIGDYDWANPTKSFRGNYDGKVYTIHNMYFNRPDENYLGLFGSTLGCVLKNIKLKNFNLIGGSAIGGVAGTSYDDVVDSCHAEGIIEGYSQLGLLFYFFDGYSIENCHVKGNIKGTGGGYIGGMSGMCNAQYVRNCTADVNISSIGGDSGGLFCQITRLQLIENCSVNCNITANDNWAGGLFVFNVQVSENTIVRNCYTTGTINSTGNNVGGFIGQIGLIETSPEYVSILNCFSTVDVTGNDLVAGFVAEYAGAITDSTLIQNCYSTGQVTGNTNVGGFIGSIDSLNTTFVYNSYWDIETSGQLTSAAGEGRTTAEMVYPYSLNTYVGWDFDTVWRDDVANQNKGYPTFKWVSGIEHNEDDFVALEKGFELYQNYPNPFNPITQIRFDLAKTANIKLSVYNINGQLVSEPAKGVKNAGYHVVDFDGSKLNSGIYYYTLEIDGKAITKKMVLIR